ncbi:DUF6461 domain-containing protein [Streptosporangium amethystogenes]|uniref:DUF6461 domain-containing protein n=1 Tax=Streptosporangium amethystogenes TaxID=2002 RepID=UPI0004CACD2B
MCTLAGVGDDLDIQYGDGVILAGRAGAWTLILQVAGLAVVLEENLMRLSEDGRRVLSVSWDIGGNHEIGYAVNGAMKVRLTFTFPGLRAGTDITALDPFMSGDGVHLLDLDGVAVFVEECADQAGGVRVVVGAGSDEEVGGDHVWARAVSRWGRKAATAGERLRRAKAGRRRRR